jgi:hypothetical protein
MGAPRVQASPRSEDRPACVAYSGPVRDTRHAAVGRSLSRATSRRVARVGASLQRRSFQTRTMALWSPPRRPVEVTVTVPQLPALAASSPAPAPEPAAGLSPFSARILDQLSLTAWLPAALVVAHTYLVVAMYMVRAGNGDEPSIENLKDAVVALNEEALGVTLAALFGVVLVTLVTQSLEFAAIRFLEGYWGGSIIAAIPTRIGVQLQQLTIMLLDRRASKLERKAFASAAPQISEELEDSPEFASAVLLVGYDKPTTHLETHPEGKQLLVRAQRYYWQGDWLQHSSAHLRHRVNSVYLKRKAFPSDHSRLMPTRLGNALRTFEAELRGDAAGSRMRGYLYERLDSVTPALMQQHTQYRNRLDMYAVMAMLAAVLAVLDLWLLPPVLPREAVVGVIAGFAALSLVSYRGAIAAAMDYGAILLAMDKVAHTRRSSEASKPKPPKSV